MKYKTKYCSKCLKPKLIEKFPRGSAICTDCELEPTSVCEACKQQLAVVYLPGTNKPLCKTCFEAVVRELHRLQRHQGKSYVPQEPPGLSGTSVTGVIVDEMHPHEKD